MRIFSIILFLFYIHSLTGQEKVRTVLDQFSQTYPSVNDLAEWRLKSELSSNGVQYYYIQQQRFGIDIENALLTLVAGSEAEIRSSLHNLVPNVEEKIPTKSNPIQVREALEKAAAHLGLSSTESREIQKSLRSENIKNRWKYTAGTLSRENIPVHLLWIKHNDEYILSYRIDIYHPFESHYWSLYINAENGSFIRKEDRILSCHFDTVITDCDNIDHSHRKAVADQLEFDQETEVYHVYPLYVENPGQGTRVVVQNPADPLASPYGWHDLDGNPGPEYFDTRGNNGFIQEDYNYNNSGGKRADGGGKSDF